MSTIKEAIGAIVDYNFEQNFPLSVAKSLEMSKSYSAQSGKVLSGFDALDKFVQEAGLQSIERSLGGHPDYNHLIDEDIEVSSITTMFADLRNFTKYGLFLSPQEIRNIKRDVISSFIYIVHAYGGHVHNIPGDGLMVYFGGKDQDNNSVIKAVMAGSSLLYALENHINPILREKHGFDSNLHMRVGIEYGEVVWGQYGIAGVNEVKATGFSVDFAAKIQQQAETDCLRIGEGIEKVLDWPSDFISDSQTYSRQFKKVVNSAKHYNFDWRGALKLYSDFMSGSLLENLEAGTDDFTDGYINPRMREIFSRQLPTSNVYPSKIVAKISHSEKGPFREVYKGDRKLPKRWHLKFLLEHSIPEPYLVEWEAVNNGYEAFELYDHRGHINHANGNTAYESTAYKGSHFMVARVMKDGVEVTRALQRVLVK